MPSYDPEWTGVMKLDRYCLRCCGHSVLVKQGTRLIPSINIKECYVCEQEIGEDDLIFEKTEEQLMTPVVSC